jgi:hypothetical protein
MIDINLLIIILSGIAILAVIFPLVILSVPDGQQAVGEPIPLSNSTSSMTVTSPPDIGLSDPTASPGTVGLPTIDKNIPPPAFRDNDNPDTRGIRAALDTITSDRTSSGGPISDGSNSKHTNTNAKAKGFSPTLQRQIQHLKSEGFKTVDTPMFILLQNKTHLYFAWANKTNENSTLSKLE